MEKWWKPDSRSSFQSLSLFTIQLVAMELESMCSRCQIREPTREKLWVIRNRKSLPPRVFSFYLISSFTISSPVPSALPHRLWLLHNVFTPLSSGFSLNLSSLPLQLLSAQCCYAWSVPLRGRGLLCGAVKNNNKKKAQSRMWECCRGRTHVPQIC